MIAVEVVEMRGGIARLCRRRKKNSCSAQHDFITFNKICDNYNVWLKLNGECESKNDCGYK